MFFSKFCFYEIRFDYHLSFSWLFWSRFFPCSRDFFSKHREMLTAFSKMQGSFVKFSRMQGSFVKFSKMQGSFVKFFHAWSRIFPCFIKNKPAFFQCACKKFKQLRLGLVFANNPFGNRSIKIKCYRNEIVMPHEENMNQLILKKNMQETLNCKNF